MRARAIRFAGALLLLAGSSATGDERWLEIRSPHFRVITNGGENSGRDVADGFEQVRHLFATLARVRVDPPAPIDIVAARDERSFRALLPSYWERRGGTRPAGVFMSGTDRHYIVVRLDVEREYRDDVAYHEYVHLISRLNFASLPLWVSEGLAEFYAGTAIREGSVLYGIVNIRRLVVLQQREPLPLADLFAIDAASREYNEESRASVLYAESALLTHYFLAGDRGAHKAQLLEYLRLLASGAPPAQAQQEAFGDLKALQKAFFSYLRSPQFLAIKSPLARAGTTATARPMAEAEILVVRGELVARQGRDDEARALLTRARQLDPRLAAAALALGRFESLNGRQAEARSHLDDAVRLAPDDFLAHYFSALSTTLTSGGDLVAAEAALRKSLQLNPSFAPAHALLSEVLWRMDRLNPAFLALHEACTLEPDEASYWLRRADLLREMKRPDVAETIETQIAQLASSDPEKLRAIAAHFRSRDRLADLEKILRRAADVNPRSTIAPRMLGEHLRDLGRADDAEAAYRRALSAQPDDPSILNTLAFLNAERGVKLEEALEMVTRALKAYPDNAAMLDTKGWTLFRLGRLEEAEKLLRRSLEREQHPVMLDHLGDVLDRRGQRAGAVDAWRRALAHPDAEAKLRQALLRKLAAAGAGPTP